MNWSELAVPLDEDDVAYVRRDYLELEAACAGRAESPEEVRRRMAVGRIPRPSYVLSDGTPMVPPDHFALADAAGGWTALPGWFAARLAEELTAREMDASMSRVAEEWTAYLAGEYRLDAIVRRFTASDRARFGASVSRERLIDAARARHPALWRADEGPDAGRP